MGGSCIVPASDDAPAAASGSAPDRTASPESAADDDAQAAPDEAAVPASSAEPSDALLAAARQRLDQEGLDSLPAPDEFRRRMDDGLVEFVGLVQRIYGDQVGEQELAVVVGDLVAVLRHAWAVRPEALRALDRAQEQAQPWWQSRRSAVAAAYADRWAGDLAGMRAQLPHLQELGITHLRLLPPFRAHPQRGDGGFAISTYRELEPSLGDLEDLRGLSSDLLANGMSLMLDVVLSRTSSDHRWARAAAEGSAYFQDFYRIRTRGPAAARLRAAARAIAPTTTTEPAAAEPSAWVPLVPSKPWDLREVRASEDPEQWDLDWSSPRVLLAMSGELLHVADLGAQVLRIDSAPHLWSAHDPEQATERGRLIVEALALMLRIAAPSSVLESQESADVSPCGARVAEALDRTAMIWSSLATRSVEMLAASLESGSPAEGTGLLQPVRHHDALTWCFPDSVLPEGADPHEHRSFLDRFYTGAFPGSFAAGAGSLPWREQLGAGVCGTAASLAGAGEDAGAGADRLLLAHAVAWSLGGVPELWLGDELGVLNDEDWRADPAHAHDPRWLHRPRLEPGALERRHDLFSTAGRVYGSIRSILEVRAASPEFDGQTVIGFDTRNEAVLGYQRPGAGHEQGTPETVVLCLANFSDWAQFVTGETLSGYLPQATLLQGGAGLDLREGLLLEAHGWRWIRVVPR